MSTVPEAIAAGHLGARVGAFSCLTNRAAGLAGAILDHDHVREVGNQAAEALARLLAELVTHLGGEP
jgi:purine-nucleoside phosphorylase